MKKRWMKKSVQRLLAMLLCVALAMEPLTLRAYAAEDASDDCVAIRAESNPESNAAISTDGGDVAWQEDEALSGKQEQLNAMEVNAAGNSGEGLIASGEENGLQWSIDKNGLLTIAGTAAQGSVGTPAWLAYAGEIQSVKVTAKKVQDTSDWFDNCKNLKSVDFSGFDTGNVKRMNAMFSGCSSLESLDLSGLDTKNVTDMGYMFSGCSGLKNLNLSGFSTGNVKYMWSMFSGCSSLESLDLSGFNTGNVTGMSWMFDGCSSLTSLNLSGFSTGKVTSMYYMFRDCSSLTSLDLSGFSTGNVTDMSYMFSGCSSLTSLNLSGFNTEKVTEMREMFYDCSSLTSMDLSSFNTGSVTTMYHMFDGCSSLTSMDLSSFDTGNVTRMDDMFRNCRSLESLNIRHFDVSKAVSNLGDMFDGCRSLKELDLSFIDFNGASCSAYIIRGCSSLESLMTPINLRGGGGLPVLMKDGSGNLYQSFPAGEKTSIRLTKFTAEPGEIVASDVIYGIRWTISGDGLLTISGEYQGDGDGKGIAIWTDSPYASFITRAKVTAKKVRSTDDWFRFCYNLSSVDFEDMDTENLTDMSRMFWNCYSLTEVDLSNFNTENVTNMDQMFDGCRSLKTVNLGGLNAKNVTDMSRMFSDCSSLETLNLSGFKTENVTSMNKMFSGCSSLKTVNLDGFNTENVTDMRYMFSGCSNLETLDLSGFKTENVTSLEKMFSDCSSLKTVNLNNFNTKNVTNMNFMFDDCNSLETLNLSGFNTGNVKNMELMFAGCHSLTELDLSSFNTENVTSMGAMFDACRSLKNIDLSGFDTENVTDMGNMFRYCSSLETIKLESFKTQNVTDMMNMFYGCSSLKSVDLSSFDTQNVTDMRYMFFNCSSLKGLDLSHMDCKVVTSASHIIGGCNALQWLRTPINLNPDSGSYYLSLPFNMYDKDGQVYKEVPTGLNHSIELVRSTGGTGNDPVPPVEKTFKVDFDRNGHGGTVAAQNVREGDKVAKPKDPTAKGFIFGGWYRDPECTKAWNFETDTVNDSFTLYAKWTEDPNGDQTVDTESPEDEEDDYYDDYYTTADGDDTKVVRIDLAASALGTTITGVKGKTYDGKPYQPAVKVTVMTAVGGKSKKVTLTEGVDYRVLYENNIHAGKGYVIIRGSGAYKGEKRQEFTIQKKPIGKLKMITGSMGLSASDIPLKVYDGGLLLEDGTDYELDLGNADSFGTKAGKYTVTVKAAEDSDYTGSKAVKITVCDTEDVLTEGDVTLSLAGVELSDGVPYTGSAIKPTVTVTHNGKELSSKEFSVKYTNNKEAGTAYVTVTGKKPYSGSVVKTFEITPAEKTFKLKSEIKNVTYNGKLQKPKAAITVDTVAANGKTKTITLKAGKDYLIYYSNNLHATKGEGISRGRAKITVKGIGNYADCETAEFNFDILPQQMKKASVKGAQGSLEISYAKKPLVADIDYTVSYGTPDAKSKVDVTLKGKGDFTGEVTKKVKAGSQQ